MNVKKDLISIGVQIRRLRKAGGYSQEEFANIINMNRGYYGTIERGETNFSVLALLKILRGLGIISQDQFSSDFYEKIIGGMFENSDT